MGTIATGNEFQITLQGIGEGNVTQALVPGVGVAQGVVHRIPRHEILLRRVALTQGCPVVTYAEIRKITYRFGLGTLGRCFVAQGVSLEVAGEVSFESQVAYRVCFQSSEVPGNDLSVRTTVIAAALETQSRRQSIFYGNIGELSVGVVRRAQGELRRVTRTDGFGHGGFGEVEGVLVDVETTRAIGNRRT